MRDSNTEVHCMQLQLTDRRVEKSSYVLFVPKGSVDIRINKSYLNWKVRISQEVAKAESSMVLLVFKKESV